MAKKHTKKVRRVEVEKVKGGDGGHLHKVTVHHHDEPRKEGQGMKGAFPAYVPPEETYHTSHHKASRHMKEAMGRMTATPEEEPEMAQTGMTGNPPNDTATASEDEE